MEKVKRYKQRTTFLFIAYVFFIPLIIMFAGIFSLHVLFIGSLAIVIFSYAIPYNRQKKSILTDVKDNLISQIIPFLDPSFRYEATNYIPKEVFLRANFYATDDIDHYKGEDYIHGKVGEIGVKFSEIEVIKEENKGDSNQNITLFKGLFFVIDFHKPIHGTVYAVPKKERFFISKRHVKKDNDNHIQLEDVILENPEFHKRYVVRSSDQTIARYVFTPSLMEKLLNFQENKGVDVLFSVQDGNMYLGLNTYKDHFDIHLNQPINEEILYDYFKDVKIAFDMVEELNINTRIWG